MKRLTLSLAVLTLCLSAADADAGPLRTLAQRIRGCGGCRPPALAAPPPSVRYGPAPQLQPPPAVVATSYDGLGVPADATPYQPIRLTAPLPTCPTCVGGVCR